MAKENNRYLNGVSWSNMKKFAKHTFHNENYKTDSKYVASNGNVYYKIFIDRKTYWENIDEVNRFVATFSKGAELEILPMD